MLYFGARNGVLSTAWAYSVGMLILVYPCMKLAFRKSEISFIALIEKIAPASVSAFLAGVVAYISSQLVIELHPLISLMATGLCFAVFYYMALVYLFNKDETINGLVRQVLKRDVRVTS